MPVTAVDTLYQSDRSSLSSPVEHVVLITPSDTDDVAHVLRGFSFAAAGAIKVTPLVGEAVVIPSGALAAGVIHPIRVKRVWSGGTGATGIVGYY